MNTKQIVITIALVISTLLSFSQELKPFKENNKWGFANDKNEVIIYPKYDKIEFVNDTTFRVFIGNPQTEIFYAKYAKCGIINNKAQEVIPVKYDYIWVENSLFFVFNGILHNINCINVNEGFYGVYNAKGKEIIPCKYEEIIPEGNYIRMVGNSQIDFYNRKMGLLNFEGKEIVPLKYRKLSNISKDLFIVKNSEQYSENSHKMGVINSNNKIIVDFKYNYIDHYGDINYLIVFIGELKDGSPHWGKYGIINFEGKEIKPVKYSRYEIDNIYHKLIEDNKNKENTQKEIKDKTKNYNNVTKKEETKTNYFYSGLAIVEKSGKYGFINIKGEEIIIAKYQSVKNFSYGLAAVKLNDKWGYINTEGETIIKFKFDNAYNFTKDGFAKVIDGEYEEYTCDFKDIEDYEYYINLDSKIYFINRKGKKLKTKKYSFIENFNNGYANIYKIEYKDKENEEIIVKQGLIDVTGKEVIPVKYNKIFPIYDKNRILVKNCNSIYECDFRSISYMTTKYGCINMEGKEVVPVKYNRIFPFKDGFARVYIGCIENYKQNGKYGMINENGKEIIPVKYDYVLNFYNGLAKVFIGNVIHGLIGYPRLEKGKYGYYTETGENIIPVIYDKIYPFSDDGIAKVFIGEIDENGNPRFGKYGFINKQGQKIISCTYKFIDIFYNDVATVQTEDNKFGRINRQGKIIMPIKYDFIEEFKVDIARIIYKNKVGCINKNGKLVIPLEYDYVRIINDSLILVYKGNIVNEGGTIITPIHGKYGFVDNKGNEITQLIYDNIEITEENRIKATLNGKEFYINTKGERIK